MHELSIAQSLVQSVSDSAERAEAKKVNKVFLRVGALSGVVKDAILFAYDIATKGSLLEGSELIVTELPVIIYCASPQCQTEHVINMTNGLRCPKCNTPSAFIRQGRELELEKIEIEVD
jgi:hydrogenase nickel incorporation protein HypA/HybF